MSNQLSLGELNSLALTANEQHRSTISAAINVVEHAVACGEALIAARSLVPDGTWGAWCEANLHFTQSVASKYIRLATHRDLLSGEQTTIYGAMAHLSQHQAPATPNTGNWKRPPLDEWELSEAKLMRSDGAKWGEIAAKFGCSVSAIRARIDPGFAENYRAWRKQANRRNREARKALRAKKTADAIAKIGGDASVAYAAVRKAALAIDKAIGSANDNETKALLARALAYAHKAEDEIVFAMKVDRRTDRRPLPARAKNALHGRAPGERKGPA